jgi:hypothetical protein
MPAASTCATNVAMGGSTATGCTAATTATGAGTGAGAVATVVDGVVGFDATEIVGRGSDVGGVVVVRSTAPVVDFTVVRAASGLEDGTDEARWGLRTMTVVTARAEATQAATTRTGRRRRPESDARSGAGETGGVLSTMC